MSLLLTNIAELVTNDGDGAGGQPSGPGGFASLTAAELLGHLERYDSMANLGVDCPSALVYRAEDAPPLPAPPPEGKS